MMKCIKLIGNGGKPVDSVCKEVSEGVFERKYAKYTVKLDCNDWSADFVPGKNVEPRSALKSILRRNIDLKQSFK